MVPPVGIEPTAASLGRNRSNPLSYGGLKPPLTSRILHSKDKSVKLRYSSHHPLFHMKLNLKKNEKILVFLFFLILPLEKRHIFFSMGYQYGDFSAISLYISDILAILLISIGFYQGLSRGMAKNKLFLTLIAFIAIELIISPHGTFATFSALKWLELVLIFAYFAYTKVSYATILNSIAVSGVFQSLIGIAQFIHQKSLGLAILGEAAISPDISGIAKIDTSFGKFVRAYGTFAHPNQLAAFLVVACATTFVLLLQDQNKYRKLLYIAGMFIIILGEILTFSRAGWAAIIIVLILIPALSYKFVANKKQYLRALFVVLVSLLAGILIVWPFLGTRITVTDASTTDRIYYDQAGLKQFKLQPILGAGLGQLMPAMGEIENFTQAWMIQPPHNYFIDVACETGLIGLAVIFYIFGNLLHRLWEKFRTSETGDREQQIFKIFLGATVVAIIFLMQFDHYFYTLQQTQLLLWAILGIMCGIVYRETNSSEN